MQGGFDDECDNDRAHDNAWSARLGDVIAALDTPALPACLDAALRRLAFFDLSVIFAYPPDGGRPLHLHDGLGGHGTSTALRAYLDGAYLLDPFYVACTRPILPRLYRMRDVAPDAFFEGEYVNNWEVHPCISMDSGSLAEEIGYVVELPDGLVAVYSLMRRAGRESFNEVEFTKLRDAEPIVREVLRRHWPCRATSPSLAAVPMLKDQAEFVLDRAFASFCPDVLSTRERLVTQLVLRGHSNHSVAGMLEIAEGTVKNHRKSIYAKLGIASQHELFSRFLGHALDASNR